MNWKLIFQVMLFAYFGVGALLFVLPGPSNIIKWIDECINEDPIIRITCEVTGKRDAFVYFLIIGLFLCLFISWPYWMVRAIRRRKDKTK